MKRHVVLIVSVLLLLFTKKVEAKDTIYSLNKYKEEELKFILADYKEDKVNGFVVAGTYVNQEDNDENQQVLLMKYSKNGSLLWNYTYGTDNKDEIYGLSYSYDEEHNKNGFTIITQEEGYTPIFIKVDNHGKIVEEKPTTLESNTKIEQLIEIEDGYIIIGSKNDVAFIARYNSTLDLIGMKDYEIESTKTTMTDGVSIGNMFYGIVSLEAEETSYQLIKIDLDSNIIKVVKEDFEKTIPPKIEKGKDYYLLYGLTKEVKLSDQNSGSYYLKKYNLEDEEEWETIGSTPIDEKNIIQIQTILDEENVKEYLIMSTNNSDNAIEVTRIDSEGVIDSKVKKLKNDYYDINEFYFYEGNIYFIGQMNCPEDDNCDYDATSLFLVSDEDKVIEVKDNDSKTILVITTILITGIIVVYIIRKKKKLSIDKKKR